MLYGMRWLSQTKPIPTSPDDKRHDIVSSQRSCPSCISSCLKEIWNIDKFANKILYQTWTLTLKQSNHDHGGMPKWLQYHTREGLSGPKKYLRNFLHDPLLVCQMICHGRAEEQRIAAWSICCKGILCCCKIDIWSQRDLNLSAKAMAFRFRICSTMNKHNYELWCKLDISTFRNNSMVLTK